MVDDNRNYNRHNNRNRGGGYRHGRGGRSGRPQRPLLSSAINGGGLCLVALVVMGQSMLTMKSYLGYAVICFGLSAIVSYFAQRNSNKKWIEKLSDLFFLVGVILVIVVGGTLSGIWGAVGL